ncbi:hypothetical protein U8607_12410 [Methylobacterium durans]|uniref:DUF6883 domain-containing protein n=1 Tax=Methylobacterium durans TaxID=2202825 RepID=UPI002AFFB49F|nr:DUF6883 domain-containing protein [Methylobacterium durans]MEA1832885.1 hypothetical protein [Methylobacterium durans]
MSDEIAPPDGFAIATAKLSEYLLNPDHPAGGAKARYFLALGFRVEQPDLLGRALFTHADPCRLKHRYRTLWGVKFVFEGPLDTPGGRRPFVRSVWQTAPSGEGPALLVTAYPP